MPFTGKKKNLSRPMLYSGLICLFWTVVICVLLVSTFKQLTIDMEKVIKYEARTAMRKDLHYRRWNAMYGGVYAPITEQTPPNPFLEVAERDIQTPSGRSLTLINPAYMTRQVHEIGAKETGVQGHLTSLNPLNPGNAPSPWETQALRAFENGQAEVSTVKQMNGGSYLCLMRPFITERGCLQCHAKQGYKEGDIRGGITVFVPMEPHLAMLWRNRAVHGIRHGIIWLLGLIGIVLGSWRIKIEIDERTKKEGGIRESEQRLTQIFNFLPDPTIVIDKKGKIQAWNHAIEEMTGVKSEVMLGKGNFEHALPLYGKRRPALADMALQWDESYALGYSSINKMGDTLFTETYLPLLGKDGIHIWATASLIRNTDGEIVGAIESIRDITERLQTEALRERYKFIINSVKDPMGFINREYAYEAVNDAWCTMLQKDRESVIGKTVADIWGMEIFEKKIRPKINRCFGGEEVPYESLMDFGKLGERYCSTTMYPYINDQKELSHAVVVTRDITEAKHAEEELKKLSLAIEQSPVSVLITNTKGIIEYVNPKFTKVTGYDFEEAIGQSSSILHSGKHPPEFYKDLWDTIQSGREWRGEFANKKKNGDIFWELANISPIRDAQNKITNFIVVKEDITERKRTDEALNERIKELGELRVAMLNMMEDLEEAKEKAELATQAKSDFLANMSHEIRTPMNAILGLTHLALKTDLSPRQRDYIFKTSTSAQSLLGIINDILDFSKIEAGKLTMESIEFNLNDVLNNLSDLVTVKAQEKGLEVIFNMNSHIPGGLMGDPLRLGQILLNLTNNAFKFTDRGEIVISIEPVHVDKKTAEIRFSVRDTGIGLTKAKISTLFQSFQQADTSTTRKYGGTGLGLTISRKLTEMMGGRIGVESKPGRGSTFYFTAKFGRHDHKIKKLEILPATLHELKVLVVDDNDTFRQVLKGYLEAFEFKVDTASSGTEAIDSILSAQENGGQQYDLICMDWQMPGMDGIETVRRIREDETILTIPKIIMVTGHGREDVLKQMEKTYLDGFLLKPVTHSLLFDAVMAAFGQMVEEKRDPGSEKTSYEKELDRIRGARLLLLEDNEINQQVAVELLREQGFFVTVAENGKVGVDKMSKSLAGKPFDLVLMDLQMPVMDGYRATEEIRKLDSRAAIVPIIAMTADAMSGVRKSVLEAGMNDYVSKPIDPSLLFKALIRWIEPGDRELPDFFGKKSEAALKGPADGETVESKDRAGAADGKIVACSHETGPIDEKELLFDNLPGIDIRMGLSRVNNNQKLYRDLLVKFHGEQLNLMNRIQSALKAKDQKLAVRLAHTVKGVSGTIGATELQARGAALESAFKADINGDHWELLDAFELALQQILNTLKKVAALQNIKSREMISQKTIGSKKEFFAFLEQLKPYVDKHKPQPSKAILEEMAGFSWPDEYDAVLKQFIRLIGKYKFREISKRIEELIENPEIR